MLGVVAAPQDEKIMHRIERNEHREAGEEVK